MTHDSLDRTPGSPRYNLETSVASMVGAFFQAADVHREADPEGKQRIFTDLVQCFSNWVENEASKHYRRGLAAAPAQPTYQFQPTINQEPTREMTIVRDESGKITGVVKK